MRVLVAGASGTIGRPLVDRLRREGHDVSLVSWSSPSCGAASRSSLPTISLDSDELAQWVSHQDAIVQLSGRSIVGRRFSDQEEIRLRDSRIGTTSRLIDAIARAPRRPRLLVCASAIAYYFGNHRSEKIYFEDSLPGNSLLARLCADWESAAFAAKQFGVRTAVLRLGLVFTSEGQFLKKMSALFQNSAGCVLGTGRQWISWIHIADVVEMIVWLLQRSKGHGCYNATAPHPVRFRAISSALSTGFDRPVRIHVPESFIRGYMGEAANVVLQGGRVLPERALEEGFQFRFPYVEGAIHNLLGEARMKETDRGHLKCEARFRRKVR